MRTDRLKKFLLEEFIEIIGHTGVKYVGYCVGINDSYIELEQPDPEEGTIRSFIFHSRIESILLKEKSKHKMD